MKTLDVKLLRDLYASRGLLLAITSIIAIGITCFVAMQSAHQNLSRARDDYYTRCRMADFWIDLKRAPVAQLTVIGTMPHVKEVRPRIRFQATVDLDNVTKPINSTVLSLPDVRQPVINDIILVRGSYFTDRRDNEVIVNDAFARAHQLQAGDWLHLLLNNRRQELLIIGTAISSEFTYVLGPGALVPDPKQFGVFFLKQSYAEDVFDLEGAANQLVGKWTDIEGADTNRFNEEVALDAIERRLEDHGVLATIPVGRQTSNQFLSSEIDGLGAFATIVPVIFLAVAALILNVLITRLARQQRTVIGTLKAIGYFDRQVFLHFLLYGLSVGLIGGLLGSIGGYLAASGMTLVYRQFFEFPALASRFYGDTHVTGNLVSISCALAGSWRGARAMLQLNPAAAMRPAAPRRGGAIWLERIGWLWNRLDAAWRVAFRTIVRSKLRTATGLFAAMMGAGLLVNGFMMTEAQDYLLEFQFERLLRSDIDLVFESERGESAVDELASLPEVDMVEPILSVACDLSRGPYQRKASVSGLVADATMTQPHDTDGNAIVIPPSGVVLTKRLAEILHADVGSRIRMRPTTGERREVPLAVTAIADSYMGLAAYANIHYLSRQVNEELVVTGAQLRVSRDAGDIASLHRRLKQTPSIQAVTARQDLIDHLTDTLLKNQYVFIIVLVGFAGTIFFGSIVNASLVNLAERQQEVATLLAIGYGPWSIGNMFLRESLLINLIGTLLGLPIGYLLVVLTSMAYNSDLLRLPVVTASWIWIATVSLSVLFALLAHAFVQWTIFRMNFLEALKIKE